MLENEGTKIVRNQLFNSTTSAVPPLRRDIQVIPVTDNGRDLLLFIDPRKIAPQGFALDASVQPLLSLVDGRRSLSTIAGHFTKDVSADQLLDFVQMLDQQRLLESRFFSTSVNRVEEEFESADTRPPALAGSSYPADAGELHDFMEQTMSLADDVADPPSEVKALYAPHIDLRVGSMQYAEAFSKIRHLAPRRVVILATSHYSGYYPQLYDDYPFIGSSKDFELPGSTIPVDRTALDFLADAGASAGFTLSDRAHRIEHSIETHLLFANHIWSHPFSVVPILVGGIDELFYKPDGDLGTKVELFSDRLRQLDTGGTLFLISGDLSHVGKKFGDTQPAAAMRRDVESFDESFIKTALAGNQTSMLQTIAKEYDAYRVCGFPPLYSFLSAFPGRKGHKLNYHWWDESERESAVSFGSILY